MSNTCKIKVIEKCGNCNPVAVECCGELVKFTRSFWIREEFGIDQEVFVYMCKKCKNLTGEIC